MRRCSWWVGALVLGLVGCGQVSSEDDESTPSCDAPDDPRAFEIGSGEDCFMRVASMQVVPMIEGPQGGYHLWTSIGCVDCDGEVPVAYGVKDPVTGEALSGTQALQEVVTLRGDDSFHQAAGLTNFMPGDPYGDTQPVAKGTHVLLWAELRDKDGQVLAHDEVEVVVGDIESTPSNCPDCN